MTHDGDQCLCLLFWEIAAFVTFQHENKHKRLKNISIS